MLRVLEKYLLDALCMSARNTKTKKEIQKFVELFYGLCPHPEMPSRAVSGLTAHAPNMPPSAKMTTSATAAASDLTVIKHLTRTSSAGCIYLYSSTTHCCFNDSKTTQLVTRLPTQAAIIADTLHCASKGHVYDHCYFKKIKIIIIQFNNI